MKSYEGMVPSYMVVDFIPKTSLDVHLIIRQEQKVNASIAKKLILFMISQMQDWKKCEAFGN